MFNFTSNQRNLNLNSEMPSDWHKLRSLIIPNDIEEVEKTGTLICITEQLGKI